MVLDTDVVRRAPDAAPPLPPDPPPRPAGRVGLAIVATAVVAAVVPVVVATVRAVHDHWLAIGDNGYFALRARDVFSHHIPLLGTWTSAAQNSGGLQFNNPGPLFFDLLAGPTKLFNDTGLACTIAAMNIAAIIGIAVVAYRRGGVVPATAATALTAGLTWTMGSELLFDPWQPHSMLLPFFLFIVLAWSLACGDFAVLPFAVGVASLVFQTHLSYAVLVPLLALWGVGALAWRVHRSRRVDPDGWPGLRHRLRRPIVASVVVAVVCWFQPIVEQVQNGRHGNLTTLLRSVLRSKTTVGWSKGTRMVATVFGAPPFWVRPSFGDDFLPTSKAMPDVVPALASVVLVVAVLAACVWWAHRRRDSSSAVAAGTAIVGVVGCLITAGSLPIGELGIGPHQMRWLWPVAVFTTMAVGLTVGQAIAARSSALPVAAVFAVMALLFGVVNLPTYNQNTGPSADEAAIPAVRDVLSQLGALDGKHTLLLRIAGLRFAEPWDTPIMNDLDRRGHEIVVDDPSMARQLGPARAFNGQADGRLIILEGDQVLTPPPNAQRVAVHIDLNAAEQQERLNLQQVIGDYLASTGPHLTLSGERAVVKGSIPALQPRSNGAAPDPRGLLVGDEIRVMLSLGWMTVDAEWAARFARYADLQHRWNFQTVALFVAPIDQQ